MSRRYHARKPKPNINRRDLQKDLLTLAKMGAGPLTVRLFVHLLVRVDFTDGWVKDQVDTLAESIGVSRGQAYADLKWFREMQIILQDDFEAGGAGVGSGRGGPGSVRPRNCWPHLA